MNAIAKWFDPANARCIGLALLLCVAALTLGGCATHAAAPGQAAPEPTNRHDVTAARALALQKIGESATDGETKRLALFAVAMLQAGGSADNSAPETRQIAPPGYGIGAVALGVLDRIFSAAERVAAPVLAYRGGVRAAQTTERVAEISRDVSIAQSNNFTQLGIAGVNSAANVGMYATNALAGVALKPSTSIAITGNSGPVNTGSGTQYSGSYNPVNPAPVVKVCAPGAVGITCN